MKVLKENSKKSSKKSGFKGSIFATNVSLAGKAKQNSHNERNTTQRN